MPRWTYSNEKSTNIYSNPSDASPTSEGEPTPPRCPAGSGLQRQSIQDPKGLLLELQAAPAGQHASSALRMLQGSCSAAFHPRAQHPLLVTSPSDTTSAQKDIFNPRHQTPLRMEASTTIMSSAGSNVSTEQTPKPCIRQGPSWDKVKQRAQHPLHLYKVCMAVISTRNNTHFSLPSFPSSVLVCPLFLKATGTGRVSYLLWIPD